MARSTSYLMEPAQVISQMRRAREGNLKREIQALRTRYGYSLGYRPIHALLVKRGVSCSLYLVGKGHETRWFLWATQEATLSAKATTHQR
ncbi:MAG: hypothetical protein HY050_05205 [Actinobacteria bacterium]|nr:hypothetical protein [Actinomycetota bacterium]